ncbi:UbiA prenyltransferase family-domain-containing protein [Apiospora hydei]|uniref:UbiA prenyltransferase family-domain-containing protein n=1 Tax=Apiospora hydei TaxID=1337664 RepID=A0ABR1X8N7_9PEZI
MSTSGPVDAGMLSVLGEKAAENSTSQAPPPGSNSHRRPNLFTTIINVILHELDVTERLLRSNAGGSCFVFLGGLLARFLRAPPPSLADAVEATLNTLAEDALNKPYRPIPAGLITVDQAKARWFLSWTFGPLATYHLYGPWAAVHLLEFEAVITFCYVWPRWFSWFNRNLFVFLLYTIQDRILNQALLEAAVPGWDLSVLIDLTVSAWFMGTVHVQEFHDLEGDRKSDRKTLPHAVVASRTAAAAGRHVGIHCGVRRRAGVLRVPESYYEARRLQPRLDRAVVCVATYILCCPGL